MSVVRRSLLAVAAALLLAGCSTDDGTGPDPNSRSWVDDHGRVCTQVDPPGEGIALDCEYPPR